MFKERVEVSSEMLSFIGSGSIEMKNWPSDAIVMVFRGVLGEAHPSLTIRTKEKLLAEDHAADIVFVVQRAACDRLFHHVPEKPGKWYLTGALRQNALAICECQGEAEARTTLQLARSIELLCQVFAAFAQDDLVPVGPKADLSEMDAARIAAARRMIDEHWNEKLTLQMISKSCGINRDKLARGFRATYSCSVADLIARRRLEGARKMLLSTDLAVSTVGYKCGYLNNASFARAFARRFGVPPSQIRQGACAA